MSKIKYRNLEAFTCYSPRYRKYVTVPVDYPSDGASGPAKDLDGGKNNPDRVKAVRLYSDGSDKIVWCSRSWWRHDKVCDDHYFDDGSYITPLMASLMLYDDLLSDGYWFRARTWFFSTWRYTRTRWK